jgi:hypothetical protein
MRHVRVLGLLSAVLAGVALAGCGGSSAAGLELTGARTVPATGTTPPKDMTTHPVRYRLTGPHYTLGVSWVATGQQLDAADAKNLGTEPVTAPQGKELIIANVDETATDAPFAPATPVPVAAVVDGVSTTLSGLPLTSASTGHLLIMLAAAPGSTVRLRARDAGQPQELDLRTGATSGTQYQQRSSTAVWQGQSAVAVTSQGATANGTLTLGTQVARGPGQGLRASNATLSNYWEGVGWAAPGQELLAVPLPQVNIYCAGGGFVTCAFNSVEFDDSAAITFTAPGGQPIPARAASRSLQLAMPMVNDTALSAVFAVPAATTGGTVTLDLAKSQVTGNSAPTVPWTAPPQPFTLTLTFR